MVPSTSEIYENGKQTVTYVAKAVDPYVPTAAKDAAGYVLVRGVEKDEMILLDNL